MTPRESILQAILDDPDDDLHRLAYADACEEEGDLVRAEFIRLSLRYAQCLDASVSGREIGQIANRMHEIYVYACEQILADLRFDYAYTWNPAESFHDYDREHQQAIFWRGWIREIAMTQELFLEHAEALFNAHPIERVRLTDRAPADWINSSARPQTCSWHCLPRLAAGESPSFVSLLIWEYLPREESRSGFKRYTIAADAIAGLEAAALKYGRSLRKARTS